MSQKRKEVPIEVDSKNRVVKTFDGYIYSVYDTSGRLIEYYGNPKRSDDDSNFRTLILYSKDESVVTAKTYHLEDDNIKCIVKENSRYHIEKYIQNNINITLEVYNPVYDNKRRVISDKLVNRSEVQFIPYLKERAPKSEK
jgi:hypothetical protein